MNYIYLVIKIKKTQTTHNMKKLLFVALLAITSFSSNGQDRINRSKLLFSSSSSMLNNATGWQYNSVLGEWIDYNNVVSSDKAYKDKYKSLQGKYLMSNSSFKFNSLQIKTVILGDIKYYILMHDAWTGRYRYPAIREDWIEYRKMTGFIFDETEYQNLKNYKNVTFSTKVEYDLEFESYDETKFLDLIQTELSKAKTPAQIKYEYKWGMMIEKTKDNNIRFLTPTILSLFENKKYSTAMYDFSKMYFETDSNNFNRLFDLK